nr:MAG TPA: hypothetical protein [Microviridae sp.]
MSASFPCAITFVNHICLLKMSIVTIVIIRHPLNKLQFQSDQQAIKILNIEQYILINQSFTNIT